jgi:hypothetical protein
MLDEVALGLVLIKSSSRLTIYTLVEDSNRLEMDNDFFSQAFFLANTDIDKVRWCKVAVALSTTQIAHRKKVQSPVWPIRVLQRQSPKRWSCCS